MQLKINGTDFLFFNDYSLALKLDAVASIFSFTLRFNPDNPQHRSILKPLSYPKVEIFEDDGTLRITGNIVSHTFVSDKDPNLVTVSGYSKGGILEDCNIPLSSYPLESLSRSLQDIARRLLSPFSLNLVIDPGVASVVNGIYEKTVAEPGETIAGYLAKLASQRNVVLSHDARGNVVLFRPDTKAAPVFFFNKTTAQKFQFQINGQALHSEIAVLRQPSEEDAEVSLSDKTTNPLVGIYRSGVFVLSSGKETDTKKAADNKMASQLAAISLTVTVEKEITIAPGNIVEVQNPEIYLYNRSRFMVSQVTRVKSEKGTTTTISLVLPETYTGAQPKNIFA